MGCDGGTIPRRDELVRLKKKPEKKDKDVERHTQWQCCAISQLLLTEPIVACDLGRMYNKTAVIEFLLERNEHSEKFGHIRGLKDVHTLKLCPNPSFVGHSQKGMEGYRDFENVAFICPVTSVEMNGKHRFFFNKDCGCVISEKAVKEIKSDVCHACGASLTDSIVINGADDEIEKLRTKLMEAREVEKLLKKAKKLSKLPTSAESQTKASDNEAKASSDHPLPSKGITIQRSARQTKRSSDTTHGIQDDPTTSKVYKSLFNTDKKAKEQKTGFWVTYNPQYF